MKKILKPDLVKPVINGSIDEWGYILNENIDKTLLFVDETIQDLTKKDDELARLDEEKIDKTELSTFVKNTVDNYIDSEVKPNLTNTLDEHVTTVNKPDLDSCTDAKKRELDVHEKLKEGQLDVFTTQKESQLNSYVESVNKPELTRFTESQKPIIQGYTEEGKRAITEHTEVKKGELDIKTNELLVEQKKQLGIESGKLLETQKSELDKHEQSKEVELNNYVNNTSKVDIDNFTDTQKTELNDYVNITVKPDITKHVDTEKNKSTTAITKHTNAEIERINTSTDIKNKLDKGEYSGTAQSLKNDIDGKVSKSDIVNDLITGGINKPLSAEMGKYIFKNAQITDNPYNVYKRPYGGHTWVDVINKSGIYQIENPVGSPLRDTQGTLLHTQWAVNKSLGFQLLNPNYTNRFFIRARGEIGDLTRYKEWTEIFTTDNSPIQKSANGYQKLPSGLIEQWGTIYINRSGDITFPISFSNNTYVFVAIPSVTGDHGATAVREQNRGSRTENKTNVAVSTGTTLDTAYVNWRAIGY